MKKLVYISISFFIIGILLIISSLILVRVTDTKLGAEYQLDSKSVEYNSKLSIDVTDIDTKINIIASDGDEIVITYEENDEYKYQISETEQEVIFTREDENIRRFLNLNFFAKAPELSISIPTNYTGNINVSTSNAKIDISNAKAKNLTLGTSNGNITLDNVEIEDKVVLETINAELNIDQLVSKDVNMSTSNGEINISNSEFSNELSSSTSNNSIEIDNVSARSIYAQSTNNSITASNIDIKDKIELNSTNGKINLDIKGKEDNFKITTTTSNGTSNVDNSDSGKKSIEIYTTNNDIEVNFR